MNSFSGTIVAKRQQPHFRHYLVSEPVAHQQGTSKFGERGISTPTYGGLLKQPDNQKAPSSLRSHLLLRLPFKRLVLVQALQHSGYDHGQADGSIYEDLSESSSLGGWHKFSPGNRFAVRAARQSTPIHRFGTNAHAVVIALELNVFPQAPVTQFEEWPKLLRPIAPDATADGENTEPLLAQQGGREVLQIKERVKANFVPSGGFPQAVVEGDIEA